MLNEKGWEVPDPRPMERPIGWTEPESLQSMIARLIRTEVSRQASQAGAETFEEADDFDVDDDPELRSPYELDDQTSMLEPWKEEDQRTQALRAAEERFVRPHASRRLASPEGESSELGGPAGGEAELPAGTPPKEKGSRRV